MKIIKTGIARSDAKYHYDAIVSDVDYPGLLEHKWYSSPSGAVSTHINGRKVQMHRLILNAPENMEVDHINGNRLDNRRENLRLCNSSQNKCNRGPRKDNKSGYKGVSWHEQRQKWTVRIKTPYGKYLSLGLYNDKKEAAMAYNKASVEHHGEFAFINKL